VFVLAHSPHGRPRQVRPRRHSPIVAEGITGRLVRRGESGGDSHVRPSERSDTIVQTFTTPEIAMQLHRSRRVRSRLRSCRARDKMLSVRAGRPFPMALGVLSCLELARIQEASSHARSVKPQRDPSSTRGHSTWRARFSVARYRAPRSARIGARPRPPRPPRRAGRSR
jgi:hypothetical protein